MTAVRHPTRLPLQPLTAVAVLRNAGRSDLAAATLARLVEIDPALSAMVLRVANAPAFGFGGRVISARQATVLLGTRTVGSLAVGGTASLVFGGAGSHAEPSGFDDDAWAHAVTTACASAVVARVLGSNPEEAFTAGLLHNAAWLSPGAGEFLGCGAEASADLLREWGLPTPLVRAVRAHGADPEKVADPLARTVVVAHALAPAIETAGLAAVATARETLRTTSIGGARVDELLASIRREVDSVAAFLEEQSP